MRNSPEKRAYELYHTFGTRRCLKLPPQNTRKFQRFMKGQIAELADETKSNLVYVQQAKKYTSFVTLSFGIKL